MAKTMITAELDEVAGELQKLAEKNPRAAKVLIRTAKRLDTVSNSLERAAPPAQRQAKQEGPADDYLPGEFGPENEHQDAFTATNYHKVPIGKDSMSKAIGKNVSEILSDLDFAQRGNATDKNRINVQSGRQPARKPTRQAAADWPFSDLTPETIGKMAAAGRWDLVERATKMAQSRKAAEMEVQEDETGTADDLSTAALAESGDESDVPPVDASQDGGDLQFYGTYPAIEGGPDSGHHRRSSARQRLQRKASEPKAPVKVKSPEALLNDEPGDNVERDQELGGLSGYGRDSGRKTAGARTATIYRPTHVPKEAHAVWHGVAQHLANQGRLLTASGHVNYEAINAEYTKLIGALGRVASKVDAEEKAARRAARQ